VLDQGFIELAVARQSGTYKRELWVGDREANMIVFDVEAL
jgi:hypothetical protein